MNNLSAYAKSACALLSVGEGVVQITSHGGERNFRVVFSDVTIECFASQQIHNFVVRHDLWESDLSVAATYREDWVDP